MEQSTVRFTRLVGPVGGDPKPAPVSLDVIDLEANGLIHPHVHKNSHQVFFVQVGEISVTKDGTAFPLREGQSIEILPGTTHSVETRQKAKILVFSSPERTATDTTDIR